MNSLEWSSSSLRNPVVPSNFVPSGSTPDASILLKESRSRHFPRASKFSMENPMGSIRAWHPAHAGLGPMLNHCIAHRERFPRLAAFRLQCRNIGRRRRRRRRQQVFQNPLATQYRGRSIGIGRHGEDASLSQKTCAWTVFRKVTRRK